MKTQYEISVLVEDDRILDADEDELEKLLNRIQEDFQETPEGKALLAEGYICVDQDPDDNQVSFTYRKEK